MRKIASLILTSFHKKHLTSSVLASVFVISTMSLLIGCTRKADDSKNNTHLSFSIPTSAALNNSKISQNVSATSTALLEHIVVNVGADGNLIICDWDVSGSQTGPCQINLPNITLDIPSGSARLIQVLLVYQGSAGRVLKYGDITSTISGSSMSLPITVSDLGAASPFSGDIKGRYFTATGVTPSGTLNIKISPVGKPSMVIMRQPVISGWFAGFLMSGVDLTYELDGNMWFGGPVRLETFIDDTDGVPSTYTPGNSGISKSAAYGSSSQSRYVLSNNNSNQYQILGFFKNPSDGATNITSYLTTNSDCSTPEYNTCLSVASGNYYSNSRGVFGKLTSTQNSYHSFSSGTLSWKYLSGITSTQLDKVKVYKLSNLTAAFANSFVVHHETINCNMLAQMTLTSADVQDMGDVTLPTAQMTGLPAINGFTQAYVTCPYANNNPLNLGMIYSPGWLDQGTCTECKNITFDIPYANYSSDYRLTTNQCHMTYVKSVDYYNNMQMVSGNTVINLPTAASVNASFNWYSDSGCTTPITQATITSATSSSTIYSKSTTNFSPVTMTMTVASGDPMAGVRNLGTMSSGSPTLAVISAPDRAANVACYPIALRRSYYNGLPDTNSGGLTLGGTTAVTSGTAGYIGNDSSACSSSPGTGNITAAFSDGNIYYRPSATGAGTETITITASGYANLTVPVTIGNASSLPHSIEVKADFPPIDVGQCEQMRVILRNYNGVVVAAPSAMTFFLQTPSSIGAFYSDTACNTNSNQITFAVNQTSVNIYYKAKVSNTGGMNLPISITDSSLLIYTGYGNTPTESSNLTISDPAGSSLYLYANVPAALKGHSIFGSHEFTDLANTARLIPLVMPTGAYLECSNDSGATYNSSFCSGKVDASNNLIWTLADATSFIPYYLRVSMNGSTYQYKFDPMEVFGPLFSVLTCSQIITTNTTTSTLNFTTNPVICLNSGVTLTYDSSATIGGAGNAVRALIGHTSGGSTINTGTGTSSTAFSIGSYNTNLFIANLLFIGGSGLGSRHIYFPSGTTVPTSAAVRIMNNNFYDANNSIVVDNADANYLSVYFKNNVFGIPGVSGVETSGILVRSNFPFNISDSSFTSLSTDNSYTVRGVKVENAVGTTFTATKLISNITYSGHGAGVYVLGYSAAYPVTNLSVESSKFESGGSCGTYPPHQPLIYMKAVSAAGFKNNKVINNVGCTTGGFYLIRLEQFTSSTNSFNAFSDNILVESGNQPNKFIDNQYGLSVTGNNFERNQFVSKTLADPSASTILNINSGQTAMLTVNVSGGRYHGNNLLCRVYNASYPTWFASFFSGSGSLSGGSFSSSEFLSYCKKDNSVVADRCSQPCDP